MFSIFVSYFSFYLRHQLKLELSDSFDEYLALILAILEYSSYLQVFAVFECPLPCSVESDGSGQSGAADQAGIDADQTRDLLLARVIEHAI